MSFYLATVPEGVILHHGNNNEKSPTDPDWLAYEIEHAEGFARGGRGPPGGPGKGPGRGPPPELETQSGQVRMDDEISQPRPMMELDEEPAKGGWLHTYRATRSLRYLYIDGMSGGKTTMGTLDSQDYLLRGTRKVFVHERKEHDKSKKSDDGMHKKAGGPFDERARAVELCAMCKDWNLSGVIRMEAGFEIIQCDFHDGLEELQALQRPAPENRGGPGMGPGPGAGGGFGNLEHMRALTERYNGIGASRTYIDFSSMVSAFFFPINITNPDPKRPDLPRLSNTTDAELYAIQGYLNKTIAARFNDPIPTINWQGVTDLIVGRYADRLQFIVEKMTTPKQIAEEVNHLLTLFIDYSGQDTEQISPAINRCTNFYLHGFEPATEADQMNHAAIQAVTNRICTDLFDVRELVTSNSDLVDSKTVDKSLDIVQSLMNYLGWARFKRCPACDIDEVCVIPMWPFGTKEAYESPRCANASSINDGERYWDGGPGFGRRPGGGRPGGGRPEEL